MSVRRSTRVSKRSLGDEAATEEQLHAALEEKPKRTRRTKAAAAAEEAEDASVVELDDSLEEKSDKKKSTTKAEAKRVAAAEARQARLDEAAQDRAERGVAYRKTCPSSVMTRISRAMNQRLYLLSRRKHEGDGPCSCHNSAPQHTEFAVLGSTGNVYTVKICRIQTCDCPDGQRGAQCKHILFVMLKVLQVPRSSPLLYQDALKPSELEEMFATAPKSQTSDVEAPKAVQEAYKKLTGDEDESGAAAAEDAEGPKPKPFAGEFCGICYDVLNETDEVAWCKSSCGKSVHKDCFTHWEKAQRAVGAVTCVYCRAPWPSAAGPGGAGAAAGSAEGYTNLSHLTGQDSYRPDYYGGYYRGYRGYYRDW